MGEVRSQALAVIHGSARRGVGSFLSGLTKHELKDEDFPKTATRDWVRLPWVDLELQLVGKPSQSIYEHKSSDEF